MPAEPRVRSKDDEERLFRVLDAAREEDESETIGWRRGRLFDVAVKHDELLGQRGILSDEVGFIARQIGGSAENIRMAGGSRWAADNR